MTNEWTLLAAITVVIGWIVLIAMAFITLQWYRKRKFLRCPETGGIALVDIEKKTADPAMSGISLALKFTVKDCLLWPKRIGCGNGCLKQ